MASYMMGDDMMGAFLPGLFSAKLAKKTIAKFDPTSKTAKYGGAVRKTIGFVTGGLVGSKVASTAFLKIGAMRGAQMSVNKAAQAHAAAAQQNAIAIAQEPTPAAPEISPSVGGEQKKSSFLIPALVGVGAIAAATMM